MLTKRYRIATFHRFSRSISYILGIETSCDDTAAAIVDSNGNVLSDVVSSQWELNARWKGIVPALAARAHNENLPHVISAALRDSGLADMRELSAVAVTSGPGLSPCLDVGLKSAMQLAKTHELDFLRINHLEAHILVSRLPNWETEQPEFPFLVLLVSGGHCCLVLAKGIGHYDLLGSTVDDAIGEAYDKVARMLDLLVPEFEGVHGGKIIEQLALKGNDRKFDFTEPMKHRMDCDFSYSGLKTAMLRKVKKIDSAMTKEIKADLCASFQRRAVDQLITRTRRSCEWAKSKLDGIHLSKLVVCGGVASNKYLRLRVEEAMAEEGLQAIFPPLRYCTDNGVMIAWAGHERYALGVRDVVENARYQPRWSLDTLTPVNFNRTNVI